MTGAGTGTLVAAGEQSFMGSLVEDGGNPDLFELGVDPNITNKSLDNALRRHRRPEAAWTVRSVKGNFEGAFAVEATVSEDVHTKVEDQLILNGPDTIEPGLSQSGRIFSGVDYPTGQATEEYFGCIPLGYDIIYQQGQDVRYSLTMAYAKQESDPSEDLTAATRTTDDSAVAWHGFDLQVDGSSVTDLQEATLSLSDLSRFQRGLGSVPNRGITAAPMAELEATATFVNETRLDLAKGGPDTTSDTIADVPGQITLTPASGTVLRTYDLAKLTPGTYSENNTISPDDTTDTINLNVDGEPAVTIT